jgi:hypothetical protein
VFRYAGWYFIHTSLPQLGTAVLFNAWFGIEKLFGKIKEANTGENIMGF